eukprot:c12554_g1_i1.p1 GENE.c12554_g1_i1~~c12554_g1_i1.p1  ORF type:complete len:102 (-),score=14.22 c12554_g1_i1:31-336(-)
MVKINNFLFLSFTLFTLIILTNVIANVETREVLDDVKDPKEIEKKLKELAKDRNEKFMMNPTDPRDTLGLKLSQNEIKEKMDELSKRRERMKSMQKPKKEL